MRQSPAPPKFTTADIVGVDLAAPGERDRGSVGVVELRGPADANGGDGALAYRHERDVVRRHYGAGFDPEVDIEGWGGG